MPQPARLHSVPTDSLSLIEEVLAAHAEYCQEVRNRLSTRALTAAEIDGIRRDDCCRIGIWLHHICESHGADVNFLAVCAEHTRFHNQLAALAERAQHGDKTTALAEIDAILSLTGGGFHGILTALTRFLKALPEETRGLF